MNILGIDIGGTKVAVCVGDEHGHIWFSRRRPTGSGSPAKVLLGVIEMARDALREVALDSHALDAVGISAPGPLSVSKGLLLAPPNMPGWNNVPVVRMFAEAFEKPVS